MKRKLLSWLLILCLVVTLLPLTEQNASAATPSSVSVSTVKSRLNQLATLNGKYFTTDRRPASEATISKTNVWSVLKSNSTVRSLNSKYKKGARPSYLSYLPTHYQGSNKISSNAWQCAGFANYAMWYLFANKYNDKVVSKLVYKNTPYNYKNIKAKVKPGDIIGNSSWPHSAVVIEVKSSGVKVIESNIRNSNEPRGMNRVGINIRPWSDFNYVSIVRAKNYATSSSWQSSLKATNSASSGKTVLSWSSYSGASKYYVYRKKGKSGIYSRIASTSSRSLTDKSAVNGKLYYYYVKAVSKSGKILKTSSAVCRTCDLARPTITGISNVASSGAITLSFKGVANANKYKIYRATSKNGTYNCIYNLSRSKADKGGETVSFINAGATPGKTYYYKVRAVTTANSGADSAASGYAYRTRDLARPVVSAKTQSDGKIVLSWGKISYADKYDIYRAVKGGSYSKLTTVTGTSYTDTKSLKDGTTYYYRVKAIDNSNSAATSASSVTVIQKYENKVIGLVSEATYKAKYANSSLYSATPYYRYRTRSMQTTTSTSSSLSGWTLISKETGYKYGSWTTTKPSTSYESKSAYYYYTYVCDCKRLYWKSTKSDTCPNCKTKMRNLLKVYSSNNPASYYKKDTDGSYFTPKVIDKSNPGKFGTIYYMTYKGSSISKFTSTSKKNTSFLWPSSSLKQTVYRTKTPTTVYKYQKWGDWSSWSGWTSKYKENTNVEQRDTTVQYYIMKK